MRGFITVAAAIMVVSASGCASTVQKSDQSLPAPIASASGKSIVLNMTGSVTATTAKDWNDFKGLWREPCTRNRLQSELASRYKMANPDQPGTRGPWW
jgi:hypothetical protein